MVWPVVWKLADTCMLGIILIAYSLCSLLLWWLFLWAFVYGILDPVEHWSMSIWARSEYTLRTWVSIAVWMTHFPFFPHHSRGPTPSRTYRFLPPVLRRRLERGCSYRSFVPARVVLNYKDMQSTSLHVIDRWHSRSGRSVKCRHNLQPRKFLLWRFNDQRI